MAMDYFPPLLGFRIGNFYKVVNSSQFFTNQISIKSISNNNIMAKTEHYFTKFECESFYHIYNRSIDRKPMFLNDGNYHFSLQQYDRYLSPVVETFSYCLLGNHFHLLVRVRSFQDLTTFQNNLKDLTTFQKLSNLNNTKTVHEIVSHQFRKFFQSYAMAFNKQHNHIGTLFQTPFKRVRIDTESYLTQMVYYIHSNPAKHSLINDFREWKWSSYHSIKSDKPSKLMKKDVINWFGSTDEYIKNHEINLLEKSIRERIEIED